MKAEVTVSLTILYGKKSYELWGQFNTENEVTDTEKEIWGIVRKIGSGAKSLTQLLGFWCKKFNTLASNL
ncbi:hypothetical protein [Bacillus sp. ISL-77]|uniref:hypothetical protein n=1 Tax=unclassified Bacillus (in: firmicutes) TaxID=185979 RepID=UPI0035A86B17